MGDVRVAVEYEGKRTVMVGDVSLVISREGDVFHTLISGTASKFELAHVLGSAAKSCVRVLVKKYGTDAKEARLLIDEAVTFALGEEE